MSSSTESSRATTVRISAGRLEVELADGRKVIVPLTWFPRLDDADEAELRNWRLIGKGEGIRWPDLDEDVSVFSLLYPEKTIPSREIRQRQE